MTEAPDDEMKVAPERLEVEITLTPVPDLATLSVLALGWLVLLRRKAASREKR